MPEILGTLKPPRLATAPSSPALGQIFYDTAASALKTWNGSAWVPASVPADTVVTAATRILANKLLSADANPAFRIFGDGKMEWGAGGSNVPDLSIYRYGSSSLAIQAGLAVRHDWGIWTEGSTPAASAAFSHYAPGSDAQPRIKISGDGKVTWGPGGATVPDTSLYRWGAHILATDDDFLVNDKAFTALVNSIHAILTSAKVGESFYRFTMGADGGLFWGSGAAAQDTNLYRASADYLQTDDNFTVAGQLAVGNTVVLPGSAEVYKSNATFFIGVSGGLQWGPGDWSRDVNLYRWGADYLKTDNNFVTAKSVYADAAAYIKSAVIAYSGDSFWETRLGYVSGAPGPGIWFSSAYDTGLYRYTAGYLATDGQFYMRGGTNAYMAWARPGEQARFFIGPDGNLNWGSGAGAQDTNMYRAGSGALKTDTAFYVGGQVYANHGAATQIALANDGKLYFGSAIDTNLYRSAADTLKTDDSLEVGGTLKVGGVAVTPGGGGSYAKLTEASLVAAANKLQVTSLDQTYETIILEFILYTAAASGAYTDVTFDVQPNPNTAGNNYVIGAMGYNGAGMTVVVQSAGSMNIALGRVMHHDVDGTTPKAALFGRIEIFNYAKTNARKGLHYSAIGRAAYAGNNNDMNTVVGNAIVGTGSTTSKVVNAITGFQFDAASNNFGIGSRVVVYGRK